VSDRPISSRLDPDRIHDRLIDVGNAWADTKQAAMLYEKTEKTVLAKLVLKHQRAGARSHAEATTMALADPEFEEHVRAGAQAKGDALRAEVAWDAADAWVRTALGLNANERESLKSLNLVK
jgi:hypothetical protein